MAQKDDYLVDLLLNLGFVANKQKHMKKRAFRTAVKGEAQIKPPVPCDARRSDAAEMSIQDRKSQLVSSPTRSVILVCLLMGSLCILSTILKSWVGSPNALDAGILLAGLVLCGISLFKQFKLGRGGLSANMKDLIVPISETLSEIVHVPDRRTHAGRK